MFRTLDYENELIQQVYSSGMDANIMIRNNLDASNNICIIYCSSNELYKKDAVKDFTEKIIVGNRFEWTNRSAANAPKKEIFIRDLGLSWYVLGLNARLIQLTRWLIIFLKRQGDFRLEQLAFLQADLLRLFWLVGYMLNGVLT